MRNPTPIRDRFESKVEKTEGCWLWRGAKDDKGYGHIKVPTGKGDGRVEKAHRAAYRIFVGEIPEGLFVLHRCDNPACVNPEHLFVGTNDDNMKDMVSKGRGNAPRGEDQHLSKLTKESVQFIRFSDKSGVSLARRFKVSAQTITDVRNRRTWRHV